MDQREFSELARHDPFITKSLFDIAEGLTMLNVGLVELLLAKGVLGKAEVASLFDSLVQDVSELREEDLVRFVVEAARRDIALFLSRPPK